MVYLFPNSVDIKTFNNFKISLLTCKRKDYFCSALTWTVTKNIILVHVLTVTCQTLRKAAI